MKLMTLNVYETDGMKQFLIKSVIFDNPPTDKALLKHLTDITKLDPLLAEDFVKLKSSDTAEKGVSTLAGAYHINLVYTTIHDAFQGDVKNNSVVYR